MLPLMDALRNGYKKGLLNISIENIDIFSENFTRMMIKKQLEIGTL